jgi:uncharacterized membrane protein YdcZ (DUF606 family)
LTFLLVLTLLLSTHSKTLDVIMVAVTFFVPAALGTLAYTRFRMHYDRDGQMTFRYRPFGGILGAILVTSRRWMLDESGAAFTKEP